MQNTGKAYSGLRAQNRAMDHLRQIALTVDEPDAGVFVWLLIESKHDAREYGELRAAPRPFDTYMEALEAGFVELKRMANYRDGPRK